MEIGSIGCNYTHGSDFVMNSPNGVGCGLMLIVKSTARFVINSVEVIVKPNSFVMFSPEMPHSYTGLDGTYVDDWLYFSYNEDEIKRFTALGIPTNKVVPLSNVEELSHLLRRIAFEHHSQEEFSNKIKAHYTEIFIFQLARAIDASSKFSVSALADRHNNMMIVRNIIYANPHKITGVNEMAQFVGMSYSGFQHLYKKIFGVSVMNDILKSRIEHAKVLLQTTGLSVRDIAEKCGYINEYSFMRKFKELVGVTPTEFRHKA